MHPGSDAAYIAFEGDRHIASGDLAAVARAARQALEHSDASVAVFDGRTSAPVELDLRGSLDEVLAKSEEIVRAHLPAGYVFEE